jgi:hypothetical protein
MPNKEIVAAVVLTTCRAASLKCSSDHGVAVGWKLPTVLFARLLNLPINIEQGHFAPTFHCPDEILAIVDTSFISDSSYVRLSAKQE